MTWSRNPTGSPLVMVANRLPVSDRSGTRRWSERAGSIARTLGLAAAARGGSWAGWSGVPGTPDAVASFDGLGLHPVALSAREVGDHYDGHCLETLAPLYHGWGEPRFRRPWREAYRIVNQRFAVAAARVAGPGAAVWVHDYHLQLVPGMLRALRPDLSIGFLLYSPFPWPGRFLQQPLRDEVLTGLLGADLIGFQHLGSARAFTELAREVYRLPGGEDTVRLGRRQVTIGTFPASVDANRIGRLAREPRVRERARAIRAALGDPGTVLLSAGAVDPAEGVHGRLEVYSRLLGEGRLDPRDTVLVHVGACGDESLDRYQGERDRIDRQVARINGTFARVGHPVIHHLHYELDLRELVALYLAADVLVATPLRHGTTLAAKEFVAARADGTGRLVLSEFTGAAADLPEANVVNPYDTEAVMAAILTAAASSRTPSTAMAAMRRRLVREDAARWVEGFLDAVAGARTVRRDGGTLPGETPAPYPVMHAPRARAPDLSMR
jgi:trehalose 6-phosphate synthase